MDPLPDLPTSLVTGDGGLVHGLYAGRLTQDPVPLGPRRGRVRRWFYGAAGDAHTAIGAAVVHVGLAATAFVWALIDGGVVTWERKAPPTRRVGVGRVPADGASFSSRRGERVAVGARGNLNVDVETPQGRLRAVLGADGDVTPAVCLTPTSGGGWNSTQKAAGYPASGRVELDGRALEIDGGGWSDWTAGRQDRRTAWRWAAGAGTASGGQRIGLNVSTGMNEVAGEDVLWIDGVPFGLDVSELAPSGQDPAGPWTVGGLDLTLPFVPDGVRAADENLLVVRSRYVQPIGRFTGTVPAPGGGTLAVELVGVTEDHEAVW